MASSRSPLMLATLFACTASFAGQWISAPNDVITAGRIDEILAEQPLAPGENIRAVPLARNQRVAHVLVQVRDREPLHYHADSDITVFLLRGAGALRIGDRELPVAAGDVLHVPRGLVHAYINHGAEPGVALVVMTPPPGPADRVLVPPPGAK